MNNLIRKIKAILADKGLLNRILFIVFALFLFRALANVPIPGVDVTQLKEFLSGNQILGLLNIFSGGGLSNLSIVMIGVSPYITSAIILQILTVMIPRLKAMYSEEGELGRKKFAQVSRLLSIPLAIIQGFGLLAILQSQGIIEFATFFDKFTSLIVIVAGSVLIMWIGELISEYGIGNGVSILILAGIVASLPGSVSQLIFSFTPAQLPLYLGFIIIAIIVIAAVVYISEAERPIPITYAKQVRGGKMYGGVNSYLPLKINQAGVMPIIFALSILLFPQVIANFLAGLDGAVFQSIAKVLTFFMQTTWLYGIFYFILVFVFTYFYTAITFDPTALSQNLQKNGAFIPGIRPGNSTREYVTKILNRTTLFGALFLGIIAVLPIVMQGVTGISTLTLGGTALLIVVVVIIDIAKRVDAQVTMREY